MNGMEYLVLTSWSFISQFGILTPSFLHPLTSKGVSDTNFILLKKKEVLTAALSIQMYQYTTQNIWIEQIEKLQNSYFET